MYHWCVTKLQHLQSQLGRLHLVCLVVVGAFFSIMLPVTNLSLLKHTGSVIGSMAAGLGGICLGYYIWREVFVKLKQQKRLPLSGENGGQQALLLLRLIHPLAGIMMLYLVLLHAGLMLRWGGVPYRSSLFVSGIACLLLLAAMLFLGMHLRKKLVYRRWHRILALWLLLFYLGHVSLKIVF